MTYTLLPGTKAPVKVWTDPWTIKPEAARQLRASRSRFERKSRYPS